MGLGRAMALAQQCGTAHDALMTLYMRYRCAIEAAGSNGAGSSAVAAVAGSSGSGGDDMPYTTALAPINCAVSLLQEHAAMLQDGAAPAGAAGTGGAPHVTHGSADMAAQAQVLGSAAEQLAVLCGDLVRLLRRETLPDAGSQAVAAVAGGGALSGRQRADALATCAGPARKVLRDLQQLRL
jgi:hypothetical protein